MKKILATAALMIAVSSTAFAGTYGEVGVGTFKEKVGPVSVTQTAVRGIIGTEVNDVIAIEGHLATGVGSTTASLGGFSATLPNTGINHSVGLFVKASAPVSDTVTVFGRVGTTHTSMKYFGESASSSQGAYGIGATYSMNKKTALTVDYTQYTGGGVGKMSSIATGLSFKF